MKPTDPKLSQLFTGNTLYQVPFYQRSYVWQEDKWARFLEDMYYVSSSKKSYFLGSIILKQENSPSGSAYQLRSIIDGQQRFTTIFLFFKTLSLKNPEYSSDFNQDFIIRRSDIVSLRHSINDKRDFDKIMSLTEDKPINVEKPSRIVQAYNYFQSVMKVEDLDYSVLMNNLLLICLDLNDEDDEQKIFDTINSLGEPLTTGELLKNYFFKEDTREEYEELWRPIFEEDNETVEFWNSITTQGRIGKTNIDAFFNALLQIKIHNNSIPGITAEYKARIKRNDRLFHNYKELINTFGLDKTKFIYELIEYAQLYKDNISPEIETIALSGKPCIERINFIIKVFDCSTLIPYILYVLKNVKDEDERLKIYDYLESYITRRIIAKSSNNSFSDLFAENLIGVGALTQEALRNYIMSKGPEQALAMPNDDTIYESVKNNEFNNKRSLSILYLLETRLRSSGNHSTMVFPFEAYSLEHIMPKKWVKNWPMICGFDESLRNHYIMTLGNHTMLNSKLNTAISNSAWQDKLNGNRKHKGLKEFANGLVTIKDILSLEKWNENEIISRSEWLAQQINKMWLSHIESDDSGFVLVHPQYAKKENTHLYSIDGSKPMSMASFVPFFVKKFVESHTNLTYSELKRIFSDDFCASGFKFRGFLCSEEVYNAWDNDSKNKRYKPEKPGRELKSSDGVVFYVNTQWTTESMTNIIELAKKLGFSVEVR